METHDVIITSKIARDNCPGADESPPEKSINSVSTRRSRITTRAKNNRPDDSQHSLTNRPRERIRIYRLYDAVKSLHSDFCLGKHQRRGYICGTGRAPRLRWFFLSINLTSCWFSASGTCTRRIAVPEIRRTSMKYHFLPASGWIF